MGGMETSAPYTSEIVASNAQGCGITSGGGFSAAEAAPAFQKAAIAAYFTRISPTQSTVSAYNAQGRGYPDVALAGSLYSIMIGGQLTYVSGTSCSAPAFAAMVSLVNSARLAVGGSPVGYLNPSIYANNGAYCKDITSGNNQCTAQGNCCQIGFSATTGESPYLLFRQRSYV